MKKLTISIVNYNAGEYLLMCLKSLRDASKRIEFDVVVVDNASSDDSLEKAKKNYPEFKFIESKENLGYGKAHNIVLKQAATPFVLVLNPDTLIYSEALLKILDYMENNPSVGVASPRIEKSDGSLELASHRGFPTPWASFLYYFLKNDRLYHLTDRDMTKIHEVDSVIGAFMFIRKSALDKAGYFDEDYFLYGEDIDICFRIKKAGYSVMYLPEIKAIHAKGISSGIKEHSKKQSSATEETKNKALNSFYESMKIFYKKHYEKKYPWFLNKIVYLAIDIKWQLAKRKKIV